MKRIQLKSISSIEKGKLVGIGWTFHNSIDQWNELLKWVFLCSHFPQQMNKFLSNYQQKLQTAKTLKTISSTTQITHDPWLNLMPKWDFHKQTKQQFSFDFPQSAETVGWKWWDLKLIIASSETWKTFPRFFFPPLSLWSEFLIFVYGIEWPQLF